MIPKAGSVVVFQHDIYHSGMPLIKGRKYTIRCDVMYEKYPEDWDEKKIMHGQSRHTTSTTSTSALEPIDVVTPEQHADPVIHDHAEITAERT